MNKSSSRIPAPSVAPLIDGKMRYEQAPNGLLAGLGQMGGLLAVIDCESGERRVIRVYENQREHGKEGDAQDVFFTSITITVTPYQLHYFSKTIVLSVIRCNWQGIYVFAV